MRIASFAVNDILDDCNAIEMILLNTSDSQFRRFLRILKETLDQITDTSIAEKLQPLQDWVSYLVSADLGGWRLGSFGLGCIPLYNKNKGLDAGFLRSFRDEIEPITHTSLVRFFRTESTRPLKLPKNSRTASLAESLYLGEPTTRVLSLLALFQASPFMGRIIDRERQKESLAGWYARIFRQQEVEFLRLTTDDSPLILGGLASIDERFYDGHGQLEIHKSIIQYLNGQRSNFYDPEVLSPLGKPTYPLESFPPSQLERRVAKSLLERHDKPGRLLICGPPGSGKTEFVKSLIGNRNNGIEFSSTQTHSLDRDFRMAGLIARKGKKILVADEAESLFRTVTSPFAFLDSSSSDRKKAINTFLDTYPGILIGIVNELDGIHESTLRRFDQIIHFPSPNPTRRQLVWQTMAEQRNLKLEPTFVQNLATRYDVTPGVIDRALALAQEVEPPQQAEAIRQSLHSFLKAKGKAPLAGNNLSLPNDPSLIHTDVDLLDLSSVLTPWKTPNQDFGASLLFWGLPGTGKSEYARTLARTLGLDCHIKKASDVLDPFVGMTEKKIAWAFSQALEENAVLVFDEVDTFLFQRDGGQRSWERTLVNEFLSQIENHPGITICTTNLLTLLDDAALRRFSWKVQFKPLDSTRLAKAFELYFGFLSPKPEHLADLPPITLGDFGSAYRHFSPKMRAGLLVRPQEIVAHLVRESDYRKEKQGVRVVGFGE